MELINRLSALDQQLFLSCNLRCQHHSIIRTARLLSRSGDGYLQILLPLALAAAYPAAGVSLLLLAALALLLERALYWLLKNTLKRRRPPEAIPSFNALIKASDEFSFPSGHTSAAFLLATLAFAVAPTVGAALYGWAFLVGCSRLVLGVHFPADILAGATLGIGIGWTASQLI